ncbi:glutathione peroxidase [Salinicoccus hispanicus]|uniref:Glutathione peroxidase n=1 Tax=Salinicoccus hispanicus TaxID=157225 RepID=A0A6N8U0R9_9STAP|nr:glutathione peroxidase [Salinicoccus hispanicus]MXQ49691.1 glutathione peroxidase [Salinicoccus hispanicus]
MSIYDISVKKANGEAYSLDKYKGKPILIANTASKCGLRGQYDELETLHKEYKEQDLVVLGFPSNQFNNQEPGSDEDAEEACRINHGVTFDIHEIIDVNGDDAHPLFKHLRSESKGMMGDKIKWNFTKFLIDRDGNVVTRTAPTTSPLKMKKDIEKLL